jgi:hypothetical protein
MGFLDRILGREEPQRPGDQDAHRGGGPVPRSEDEIAVERYEYLLRTAPPETIERVHSEAFAKLTPEQRDLLFDKLTQNADASERPADAQPATLAQAATRAELQQPGSMARTLGGDAGGGPSFGSMVGSSLLGSVAGYVIGSALVSSFLPQDIGQDVGQGDGGQGDASPADAGSSGASDGAGFDASGDDRDWGGGGDFGGGDFGGGDFGGGGFF